MTSQPPPLPPGGPNQPTPLNYAPGGGLPCPRCGQYAAKPVTFTWWGGLLGPKMLKHTKCQACGFTFNARTGQSNDTAIAIYIVVSLVIAIALVVLFTVVA